MFLSSDRHSEEKMEKPHLSQGMTLHEKLKASKIASFLLKNYKSLENPKFDIRKTFLKKSLLGFETKKCVTRKTEGFEARFVF